MSSKDKSTDSDNKLNLNDIENWDFSKVKDIDMTALPNSGKAIGDFSVKDSDMNSLNLSNVQDMTKIFTPSDLNADTSKWDLSNVKDKISEIQEKFSNTDKKSDIKPKK